MSGNYTSGPIWIYAGGEQLLSKWGCFKEKSFVFVTFKPKTRAK